MHAAESQMKGMKSFQQRGLRGGKPHSFPRSGRILSGFSSTVHCICIVQVFIQLVHAVFFFFTAQIRVYLSESFLFVCASLLGAREYQPEKKEGGEGSPWRGGGGGAGLHFFWGAGASLPLSFFLPPFFLLSPPSHLFLRLGLSCSFPTDDPTNKRS